MLFPHYFLISSAKLQWIPFNAPSFHLTQSLHGPKPDRGTLADTAEHRKGHLWHQAYQQIQQMPS